MAKSTSIEVEERFRNFLKEEERLKKKLDESSKSYELITENANDFIAIVDRNLIYEYVNEEFHRKHLGYKKNYLIGLKAYSLIHPDDIKRVLEYFKQSIKDGEGKTELRVRHRDGYYIWVEVKGKGFEDINGEMKALLVSRDITQRKEAEDKLKKSYRDVKFYKNLFMHDIANIFSTLKLSMELCDLYMVELVKNEKNINEISSILKDQIDRGSKLIRNVKKLTDLEEEDIMLEIVNASDVLEETVRFVKKSFYDKEINIFIENEVGKIYVLANNLLRDVFENILINAIKYTKNTVVDILIRITVEGDFVKIEFNDKGIGIEDDLKKETFNKGYKTKRKSKGMGLGLFLVKNLLAKYSGKIWVEDRISGDYTKGSKFIILLKKH